jgi:hypothetical protein
VELRGIKKALKKEKLMYCTYGDHFIGNELYTYDRESNEPICHRCLSHKSEIFVDKLTGDHKKLMDGLAKHDQEREQAVAKPLDDR